MENGHGQTEEEWENDGAEVNDRSCIVSRERMDPEQLIRFVRGPEGDVVPDLKRRLPGRGAHVRRDRRAVDEALNRHIAALPGRRLIFTNGDADYAGRVLERLGLGGAFELIHDIHACQYVPKPDPSGYDALCRAHDVDPTRAAFFEDMARNLRPAKTIGMTTIWVNNGSEAGNHDHHPDFIDFETDHLTPFLARILGE